MEIVNSKIENYLNSLYGTRHEVLVKMEAEANERNFPIVGPLVGKLLYQLARMIDARRVFEMGSGYGYSAFWWALAVEGGEIHCTEGVDSNRERGEAYLKEAGLLHRVKYHVGDALEIIDKVEGKFDIVFIDIDKQKYPAALDKAAGRVRDGGLLVADNVLWSGKVAGKKGDASTEAIKEFNRKLFSRTDFAASIVPVRDGVAVAYKM
jgi:predicted O-methyltransferase YrrM